MRIMVSFKNITDYQDVLCILALPKYVLAGIGSYLCVFSLKNHSLVSRLSVFIGQKVHAIKSTLVPYQVIVYGGKGLCIIDLNEFTGECSLMHSANCNDWIMDCVPTTKDTFVLVTAHNQVQLRNYSKALAMSFTEPFILYSCYILVENEIIVIFSGSVFSDVCIWIPDFSSDSPQEIIFSLKGHKGVIFSINISDDRRWITTTSDDRSVRLWQVTFSVPNCWKTATFQCAHILYSHAARVWRSIFTENHVLSVGEDSMLCFWDLEGNLMAKITIHGGSGIRAIDYKNGNIYTGGEDGGINMLKLSDFLIFPACKEYKVSPYIPRKVRFCKNDIAYLTDENLVCISSGCMDLNNFGLIEVSPCLTLLALAAVNGRFVIWSVKNKSMEWEQKFPGEILTMHWWENYILISNKMFILLDVVSKSIELFNFEKHSSCFLVTRNLLIVGDRIGNLIVFDKSEKDIIQQFNNLHGTSGVTDIINFDNNFIFTSGKDGFVKKFILTETELIFVRNYRLPMEWVDKLIIENAAILALGFSSVYIKVWDLFEREELICYPCGGGHRSFDFQISENHLNLVYIKQKKIYHVSCKLKEISKLRKGFHSKEVNCLEVLSSNPLIFVSGSEDTTLRLFQMYNQSISNGDIIDNHISSIRCLSVISSENETWLYTAGGRDQLTTYLYRNKLLHTANIRGCAGGSRYMCLDNLNFKRPIIAGGCSDKSVRIFTLNLVKKFEYSHCVLKVKLLRLTGDRFIVMGLGTNGKAAFWDVTCCVSCDSYCLCEKSMLCEISLHQSGINALATKSLSDNQVLCVTGGDDNMLKISKFVFGKSGIPDNTVLYSNSTLHSCQITGIILFDDFILSTSIDQRLTVLKFDSVTCVELGQYMTTVPDVHGMTLLTRSENSVLLCIYGKGIELVNIWFTK